MFLKEQGFLDQRAKTLGAKVFGSRNKDFWIGDSGIKGRYKKEQGAKIFYLCSLF